MLIKFKRINDLRVDNDLTIKKIASIVGITIDNFFDYANGRSNFPLDKMNEFVNYFKTNFDYVTGLSDDKSEKGGDINLKKLKQRLKEVRKSKKISQDDIAREIGDRQSTYWNYESGDSVIPISKLYLLAKYYGISIDYLVGKSNEKVIKKRAT